ncbi:hypothetical protein KGY77_10235 [Candidatus Bipolaricaulota bacterium]|nr:hypothetical protein [Candidatus Bipolaricaulota bacterium]
MAHIISKEELDDTVKDFLKEIKEAAGQDYLIVQFKEEKIVVSSLNGWLKDKKE